jgi:hypothetical protein
MAKHAVGVMNGNFRAGGYFRYAQSVSGTATKLCPVCGKTSENKPFYLVCKTDLCFGCYEESKKQLEPSGVELASLLDADASAEQNEIAGEVARFCSGAEMGEHPFTHEDWLDEKRTQEEARF